MSSIDSDLPSIGSFVHELGVDGAARGTAGAVAALAVALAADLTAQVAHASDQWRERGGTLAQADAIRARAIALAGEVEDTYGRARGALVRALERHGPGVSGSGPALGQSLSAVIEPLLAIGEAAGDAAELAELAAGAGASIVRANAVSATILAAAAAEIAAHLVEVNLLVGGEDERSARARELVAAAAARRESARVVGR